MRELEFEARSIISKEAYETLLYKLSSKYPNNLRLTDQRNVYFDTEDRAIQGRYRTLRLRMFSFGKPSQLTLKVSRADLSGDEEFTDILDAAKEKALYKQGILPDGDVKNALGILGITNIHKLIYCGEIRTCRYELFLDDRIIVLDKNMYHNITDFNIEVESTSKDKATAILNEIASINKIKLFNDDTPKSKRTIEQYYKITKSK